MTQPWEQGDEHQRWTGYLDPTTGNPTDYRTWTLRNLLGAKNPGQLHHLEAQFAGHREATLRFAGIPTTFDLDGLKQVHRHLFQDVYPWAGEIRTVHIRKGDAGLFVGPGQIEHGMREIAAVIRDTDNLRGVTAAAVPDLLAHVYGNINVVHPFREGNGRAQRGFVSALARDAGHHIDWTQVAVHSNRLNENDLASEAYRSGDRAPMLAMFTRIVTKADTLGAAADDAVALVGHDRARSLLRASYPVEPRAAAARAAAIAPSVPRARSTEATHGYGR